MDEITLISASQRLSACVHFSQNWFVSCDFFCMFLRVPLKILNSPDFYHFTLSAVSLITTSPFCGSREHSLAFFSSNKFIVFMSLPHVD